ncbi:MAG: hypothetical protein ACJ74W_25040 [Pyrinomonadaceae bacterium]
MSEKLDLRLFSAVFSVNGQRSAVRAGYIHASVRYIKVKDGYIGVKDGYISAQTNHISVKADYISVRAGYIRLKVEYIGVCAGYIGARGAHIGSGVGLSGRIAKPRGAQFWVGAKNSAGADETGV